MTLLPTSISANFSTAATYVAQNKTNGTDCSLEETEKWIVIVVPVYILFISVLGIVFNVFVLIVFLLHKKPCTVAEIYLSNLAAADLVLVSCLPFWAVNIANDFDWPFGLFLCKIINLGINMNTYCSIYFLVLVSIDRYVALVHTMSYGRIRRQKFAKLGCLLVWGLGLLLSVPSLIYRDLKHECNNTTCYLTYSSDIINVVEGMLTMFIFIIPVSIISFCTVKIIQALKKQIMEGLNCQKMEHKATTLVLVVLLAFLICWIPYHILRIVEVLTRAELFKANLTILDTCFQIFTYFAYFNSVLNPILYVIVGKNFRKKVKEVFKQWKGGVSVNMTSIRTNLWRSIRSTKV